MSTIKNIEFFRKHSLNLEQEMLPVSYPALNKFKEDMFQQLKEIENKIYLDTVDFKTTILNRVSSIEKSSGDIVQRITVIEESSTGLGSKIDKVAEIDKSCKKLAEEAMTQGLRIKNLDKTMNDNFYKYDRLYLDNLVIPGVIGEYSKYKTFKEFIEANMKQLELLLNFKEKHTLDLKSYKEKLENLIGQFSIQMTQTDRNNKDYTNSKTDTLEKIINKDRQETEKRLMDNRLENTKHAKELLLATDSLRTEQERLEDFKSKIIKELKDGIDKMKSVNSDTIDNFDSLKSEYMVFKRKFNDLAEFIKDIRFRRNLGVDVQKREIKQLSNKIEFNPSATSGNFGMTTNQFQNSEVEHAQEEDSKDSYFEEEEAENRECIKPASVIQIPPAKEAESYIKSYIAGKTIEPRIKSKTKKQRIGSGVNSTANSAIASVSATPNSKIEKQPVTDDKKEFESKEQYYGSAKTKEYMTRASKSNNKQNSLDNIDIKLNRIIDAIEERIDDDKSSTSSPEPLDEDKVDNSIAKNSPNKHSSDRSEKGSIANQKNSRKPTTSIKKNIAKNLEVKSNKKAQNGSLPKTTDAGSSQEFALQIKNEMSQLKKRTIGKINENERKILEMESLYKVKYDELVAQIKILLGNNPNLGQGLSSSANFLSSNSSKVPPPLNTLNTNNHFASSSSIFPGYLSNKPQIENNDLPSFPHNASNNGTVTIADSVYNKNITYNIVDSSNMLSNKSMPSAKFSKTSSNSLFQNSNLQIPSSLQGNQSNRVNTKNNTTNITVAVIPNVSRSISKDPNQ